MKIFDICKCFLTFLRIFAISILSLAKFSFLFLPFHFPKGYRTLAEGTFELSKSSVNKNAIYAIGINGMAVLYLIANIDEFGSYSVENLSRTLPKVGLPFALF